MTGRFPHPPLYRRPGYDQQQDGPQPQQHQHQHLAPDGALNDPESLLRQRLAPEMSSRLAPELALQQWHHQQQMPDPVHQHQQYHPMQHPQQQQQQQQHHQTMPPPPPPPPQAQMLQRPPHTIAPPPPQQLQQPPQYTTPPQYAVPPTPTPPPPTPPHHSHPAQSPASEAQTPKAPGKPTRAKAKAPARATKKRKASIAASKEESDNSVSEEEFTMEGVKTKSGRKVHRPAHFNPAQKTPSRRRGPYRRNYDARICKVCQRGHSPQSNMIVFCDGCNSPYHQLCHDPPIDDLIIAVESSEWFCAGCTRAREQRPLTMGLAGATLTDDEKRTYLASLPMTSLVELIFFAEKTYPDLPLYDPKTKKLVAAIKSSVGTRFEDGTPGMGDDGMMDADDAGAPNWEEMIVRAINTLDAGKGVQPKAIFEWISTNFPALEGRDVRAEAQPSLQAALRKDRLLREGHAYSINPSYVPTPNSLTPKPQLEPGMLAPGSGIKLPLETDADGAASMLVDDDLIAFSHRVAEPVQQHDSMDIMVRNGGDVMAQ